MITRMIGAAVRGLLVALLIALPSMLLPDVDADSSQVVLLTAMVAFVLVFVEYNAVSPSIITFRDAPPLNRLRFAALFVMVIALTAICTGQTHQTLANSALTSVATRIGDVMDTPFSPVRLIVLSIPHDAPDALVALVRAAAGLIYVLSLAAIAVFAVLVRLFGWPSARGAAFNVWINLPLFDPTAGADALVRMQRDARVAIAVGVMLPFIIPAIFKSASGLLNTAALSDSQTLIWVLTAWAFLPASLIMRGIALSKIAGMIQEKRRRSYAQDTDLLPA